MTHENLDNKSGMELGLICTKCQDGIMGLHPKGFGISSKPIIE